LGLELRLSLEFASSFETLRFKKLFLTLFPPGKITIGTFQGKKRLFWKMSIPRLTEFSHQLKRNTAVKNSEIPDQIEKGIRGCFGEGGWVLPGRNSRKFKWARRTLVMGILNVTPDSFSDGGQYQDPREAVDRALQMQEEGADWIDLGGESTRPGAIPVSVDDEKKRVLPVLKACARVLKVLLSIDTSKADVARAAVGEGAQMVNDVGALRLDPRMGKTLAQLRVPVVLMHMKGRPRVMQKDPQYGDVTGEIVAFFRERVATARQAGIAEERIILDPGFGFGKKPAHNIELLKRLWEFRVLARPLMIGPSRKSTLGFLLGGLPPVERVEATGAAVAIAVQNGADFVRVHDVKSAARVVKIADAVRYHRGLSGS
jgi:dihydropteroate synthase